MKPHFVVHSLILTLAFGCGDDGGVTDASTDAAGDTGTDTGTTDTGTITDTGTGTDGGPMGDGLTRSRAAQARVNEALCACMFMDRGFDNAEDCAAFQEFPEQDACVDMAWATMMSAAAPFYDCYALASEEFASCVEGAACDDATIAECNTAATAANMMCPTLDAEFGTTVGSCFDTTIIGETPSTCPENATASMATGDAVFSGTTILGGSDNLSPCGGGGSPDRIHYWTAPSDGTWVFDTIGSEYDTVLSAYPSCPPATLLGCNDDIEMGVNQFSQTSFAATAGQDVYLVIDGLGGEGGNYQININLAP